MAGNKVKSKKLSPEVQKADKLRCEALKTGREADRILKQAKAELAQATTEKAKNAVRKKYIPLHKQAKLNASKAYRQYDDYLDNTFGVHNVYSETNEAFTSTDERVLGYLEKRLKERQNPKEKTKESKTKTAVSVAKDKPKKAPTYTVAGKTFATMKEAKAYKAALKSKSEIKEGKKKPTHKIVSFTAKSK